MKLFQTISATLLLLQGSVSANEVELASKIASKANEVLATAKRGRSTRPPPVESWDDFLLPTSLDVRQNDRPLHHRETSFGSIDSDFSFQSVFTDFSFRSSNSHFSHGIGSAKTRISELETAKQELNVALERVNIFIVGGRLELYEAANAHIEIKQALEKVSLALRERVLERALTPAEKQYLIAKLELELAFVNAKVDVVTKPKSLQHAASQHAASQHPAVAKAHRKFLEAKRQVNVGIEAAENPKEALVESSVAKAHQNLLEANAQLDAVRVKAVRAEEAAQSARREFIEAYQKFQDQKAAERAAESKKKKKMTIPTSNGSGTGSRTRIKHQKWQDYFRVTGPLYYLLNVAS